MPLERLLLIFGIKIAFYSILEDHESGFLNKQKLPKNGEKGVKNMRFQARLGNQSIDFSDFWYKTSLIY